MSMNPEIKAQWTAALRSGDYEQGTGALNEDGKFCCLGVLCELAVAAGITSRARSALDPSSTIIYYSEVKTSVLPDAVCEWAGLPGPDLVNTHPNNPAVFVDGEKVSLAELNDGANNWDQRTFNEIADIIDAQL